METMNDKQQGARRVVRQWCKAELNGYLKIEPEGFNEPLTVQPTTNMGTEIMTLEEACALHAAIEKELAKPHPDTVWCYAIKKKLVAAGHWETPEDRAEQAKKMIADLQAENARLRAALMAVESKLEFSPQYNGAFVQEVLEYRGIVNRCAAAEYGWNEAIERVGNEAVGPARDIITEALTAPAGKEGA